jgi:ATP-dependent DNA helicase RecQ
MLSQMYNFSTGARCRHRRLVEYFGQEWGRSACGSCDVCDGGLDRLPESTVLAQKILSCIARTSQRYGPAYVAEVLTGEATDRVQERGHDRLSTFGLLKGEAKPSLISWMHQLVDQGALSVEGEYGVLRMTEKGGLILRSQEEAVLYPVGTAKAQRRKKTKKSSPKAEGPAAPLRGADGDLYEALRTLRRELADSRNVPAFMIFSDKALRGMARSRPTTATAFLQIHGVGMAKLEQFGETFLKTIRTFPK